MFKLNNWCNSKMIISISSFIFQISVETENFGSKSQQSEISDDTQAAPTNSQQATLSASS